MYRRTFLGALSTTALAAACTPARSPTSSRAVRAVAFDLFTLFDPRTVIALAESTVGPVARELCDAWRVKQFEYCFLRAAAGQYRSFRATTADALDVAARARKVTLSPEQRATLVSAYTKLEPWPDTREVLTSLRSAGLLLAPLANYDEEMIESLLANAGLRASFDRIISTSAAGTFKPDPRAYALGEKAFGLAREEIAFSAFGGWDAAGARWFGYPTFWVNRLGVAAEALSPGPHATGASLRDLAAWVAERR
jgi:2-haloacid dehalogenase